MSQFTSSYVFNWTKHFPGVSLKYPPLFDGRIVLYPGENVVRDYFSWRQVDSEYLSFELFPGELEHVRVAHINNLYNTTFWALVQEGKQTATQAHEALRVSATQRDDSVAALTKRGQGTNSAQKNQLLFERFGINYNEVHERMRKGSVIVREEVEWFATWCLLLLTRDDKVSKEDDRSDEKDKGRGKKKRPLTRVTVLHCDLIGGEFWKERPYILSE